MSRQRPTIALEPRAVDIPTAAAIYALSESTMRDLVDHHGFPSLRIGRRIIIPLAAADRWIADRVDGHPIEAAS